MMNPDPNVHIVRVATAPNETIAMMWRDILRDEGILAMVQGADTGYTFGQNLLNEQYIHVREDQADRAREILADFEDDGGTVHWDTN